QPAGEAFDPHRYLALAHAGKSEVQPTVDRRPQVVHRERGRHDSLDGRRPRCGDVVRAGAEHRRHLHATLARLPGEHAVEPPPKRGAAMKSARPACTSAATWCPVSRTAAVKASTSAAGTTR